MPSSAANRELVNAAMAGASGGQPGAVRRLLRCGAIRRARRAGLRGRARLLRLKPVPAPQHAAAPGGIAAFVAAVEFADDEFGRHFADNLSAKEIFQHPECAHGSRVPITGRTWRYCARAPTAISGFALGVRDRQRGRKPMAPVARVGATAAPLHWPASVTVDAMRAQPRCSR